MKRPERLRGGLVKVTINNTSRRKALDLTTFGTLAGPWPELAAHPTTPAGVMSGEGEQAFRAGADFSAGPGFDRTVANALLKTDLFPKPLIAAINGHAWRADLNSPLPPTFGLRPAGARGGLPEVKWGPVPQREGRQDRTRGPRPARRPMSGHSRARAEMAERQPASGHGGETGRAGRTNPRYTAQEKAERRITAGSVGDRRRQHRAESLAKRDRFTLMVEVGKESSLSPKKRICVWGMS